MQALINEIKNYSLTKIEKKDITFLLNWFNNKSLCKYMEDSEPDKYYTEDDILSMIESFDNNIFLAFRHFDKIIGYASIYDIDSTSQQGEFSFLIGDSSMHGKGLGKILITLLYEKAKSIKLKTIYCGIFHDNIPSIKCVLFAGFTHTHDKTHPDGKLEHFFVKQLQ